MKRKLITAVRNNDTPLVAELLQQGATPNCRDHSTPLQIAIRHGNVAMVEKLLAYGADASLDASFVSHVTLARRTGSAELCKWQGGD